MSLVYEEEDRCECGHGEARHTANEVPRGHCDVTLDLVMVNQQVTAMCACKRFQLKAEPGKKPA